MAQKEALDEILWEAPQIFYTDNPWWQTLHPNNVHFYFHESPFFDRMSNNYAIETQAKVDPSKNHLLEDRKKFEKAVRDMPSGGLEFMIVSEPQQLPDGSYNETWIMQKQHRRKAQGEPDEITILAQWMIIGIQIIQCPSVFDVLASRMLSTTHALNKFMQTASSLPLFTPSAGHSYLPATSKKAGLQSASQSRAGTPPPESSSQLSQSKQSTAVQTSGRAVEQSLMDALSASIRYGTEYMDDNPLTGEPGSFVFQSTNAHIKQQQEAQAKAAATMKAMQESAADTAAQTSKQLAEVQSPQSRKAASPLDKLKTGAAGKQKAGVRRKSKAPISPTGNSPPPSR